MRHVANIKKLIDDGKVEEAHRDLDNLLELGPGNVEALRLKAAIYAGEGRFQEEEKIWLKVIELDNEDEDALAWFHNKQIEDREHYYFTDDLREKGRRFLAYPRSLVRISLVGLVGCVSFLILTNRSPEGGGSPDPKNILINFLILVIAPWIAILVTWVRTLRSVTLGPEGMEVSTRLRQYEYKWEEIRSCTLAHSGDPNNPDLRLVVIPDDSKNKPISIDLNESSCSIRARVHFINEFSSLGQTVAHGSWEDLSLAPRDTIRL